jgi:hypothetical protein
MRMVRSWTLLRVDLVAYRRRTHILLTLRRFVQAEPCSVQTHLLPCERRWQWVRRVHQPINHTLGTDCLGVE